eukprot:CAMPEP_0206279156 /NCGR_PEP_ID=MMETSP0047_2-20121206/37877_1 /ASSEMBLY_ACC=CAM_ASM_000192 /TAXON_ID=195065 /ORGANISM="Chroomonas mesostigmatica_cf, Strain CCMP1168" /LENGTH=609 /DNA_ID=CAMNT_0053709097 /DNA_START=189 /DNA_END=2019 /DNA_ORIENTATION=+
MVPHRQGRRRSSALLAYFLACLLCSLAGCAHFDVGSPFSGEIFDSPDVSIQFTLEGWELPPDGSKGQVVVRINSGEAMRTASNQVALRVPGLPKGMHTLILQLVGPDGDDTGVGIGVEFEVTTFSPPEEISPLPDGARGTRSEDVSIEWDPASLSGEIQRLLHEHQHPPPEACPATLGDRGVRGAAARPEGRPFSWAPDWEDRRRNADWEDNLVNSELKWRFNLTHSDQGSPWGAGGALQPLSWCAGHSDVGDSVRALKGVDMHDHSIHNVRVAGDLWGIENRDRLFDMPEGLSGRLPHLPNLFWWWTESTHYLHRPTPALGDFIEGQKRRIGWKHPIIGMHLRLGVDKNREAQRFPSKYYIHEARRLRRLFGGVGTIFICSDRKQAIARMIAEYGDEFEFLVQPQVEGALPMHYVHTDLALLGEADYLIMTVSSNFGMAALYLNAWNHGHRPTYISMDDLFEGFRYYGYQMTLTYNQETGTSELGVRNCAPQIVQHGRVLLHVEDKGIEAEEVCATVRGEEVCKYPKQVKVQSTGEIVWDNTECMERDDFDECWKELFERYKLIIESASTIIEKGECEEECDDHGCTSLQEGNRRVLGFSFVVPHDEF